MKIKSLGKVLLLGTNVLLLAACATTANVDYQEGVDFSSIHILRLEDARPVESADSRINSPLVDARIRTAIGNYLGGRGYQLATTGMDARLVYRITTRSGVESDRSGVSFGFGTFGRHSALGVGYGFPGYDVDSYDEAVLTIDILDRQDSGLLWRGSASRRLSDGSTPEKMTELVNALVSEILENFPPGRKR